MKKLDEMIAGMLGNMNNVFLDEEEKNLNYTVEGDDFDESFFTAELLAFFIQFKQLTNQEDMDILEFIHVLNKLAVQYLMDKEED